MRTIMTQTVSITTRAVSYTLILVAIEKVEVYKECVFLETRSGPQDRGIESTLSLHGQLLHLPPDVQSELSKSF